MPKRSRAVALVTAAVVAVGGPLAVNEYGTSFAATKAYELAGNWVDQPATATTGKTVVSAIWKFDINDDSAAPSTAQVGGNILKVVAQNARFAKLPTSCLAGSAGGSAISPDGKTLTCDIGSRAQGTAELVATSIVANGESGSNISLTATFRGQESTLDEIPIKNPFVMDARFDLGAPQSGIGTPQTDQWLSLPFSLSHGQLSADGPDTVSFDLDVTTHSGKTVSLRDPACVPNDRIQAGYPYSDGAHDKARSTAFPTCTITEVGENKFTLTLSDLKYDGAFPTQDSNGEPVPSGLDIIAAGNMQFKASGVPVPSQDRMTLTASAPTYTASDGQTSTDDASNNDSAAPITRGEAAAGWVVYAQRPNAYPGIPWTDTSRVPAGVTVMSTAQILPPPDSQASNNWVCQVLDTKYVTFQKARASLVDSVYANNFPGKIWYYTGELVDAEGNAVDPNDFACGGVTDINDPAAGNQPGWSTTLPADLSTVKAVKIEVTKDHAPLVTQNYGQVELVVEQQITKDAPVGADIWIWSSFLGRGDTNWAWNPVKRAQYTHSMDVSDKQPYETEVKSPARYPYTGPGRDVLRVVGSEPRVEASVAENVYGPGEAIDYTVKYGLETVIANPAPDTVVVTDTLPKGLTYITGSAPSEPAVSADKQGRQVLTWTFEDVQPNAAWSELRFKAQLPSDAKLGGRYVNTVTAKSQEIVRSDFAEVTVPDSGHTRLSHEAKAATVELADGAATNGWMITLSSRHPYPIAKTDVIDILPYNGDGRGTRFSGALTLADVKAPEGATVYYTTADPKSIDEDPAAEANGEVGKPSELWTTTFSADATAIRVVNPTKLPFGELQLIEVNVTVDGASDKDTYVNKAVGRAESTEFRMRTSATFGVFGDAVPPQDDGASPEPGDDTPESPADETTPAEPGEDTPESPEQSPSDETTPGSPTEETTPESPEESPEEETTPETSDGDTPAAVDESTGPDHGTTSSGLSTPSSEGSSTPTPEGSSTPTQSGSSTPPRSGSSTPTSTQTPSNPTPTGIQRSSSIPTTPQPPKPTMLPNTGGDRTGLVVTAIGLLALAGGVVLRKRRH